MAFVSRVEHILKDLYREGIARGSLLLRMARKARLLPLLLPVLVYAGAQVYLHRSALSALDHLTARLPDSMEFRFDELDVDFDGGVDIQGASLLLPGMSLPVQFQWVQVKPSHWRELPAMAKGLDLGLLPSALQIEFALTAQELSRLKTASLLPIGAVQLALGCFEPSESISAPEPEDESLFTGSLSYQFDPKSEYLNAQLELSAEQHYQVSIHSDLDIGAAQLRVDGVDAIGLGGAEIRYLNRGAQSALLNDCGATSRSGLVEGGYVAKQSARLKQRLAQLGWQVSTDLELAYQDYLFMPLQLHLQLSAAKAVNLQALSDSALPWGQFGVRVGLNSPQADSPGLRWLPSVELLATLDAEADAKKALAPERQPEPSAVQEDVGVRLAQQVEEQLEGEGKELKPSLLTEQELQQQLQSTILYKPSYKSVRFAELSGLLGAPMRLTTHNGRNMEGVLERVESDRLQLRSDISHGTAVLPVRMEIIKVMQAYF